MLVVRSSPSCNAMAGLGENLEWTVKVISTWCHYLHKLDHRMELLGSLFYLLFGWGEKPV